MLVFSNPSADLCCVKLPSLLVVEQVNSLEDLVAWTFPSVWRRIDYGRDPHPFGPMLFGASASSVPPTSHLNHSAISAGNTRELAALIDTASL